MQFSPMLSLHIAGGSLGLFSGFAAAFLRKGSNRHRVTGNIFVISMLVLAVTGAYLGFMKHEILNGCMGTLTLYLVITAWRTARYRDGQVHTFDFAALLAPLAIGATLFSSGVRVKDGSSAAFFIFGSVALLFAIGDIRMLLRGSIDGTQRLVRHLSRMCFALFVAAGSVFLTRAHLFPAFMRKSGILFVLSFLPLLLIIFWRFRLRSVKRDPQSSSPHQAGLYSLRA